MACKRCGLCCREPGWLKPADWEKIARRLGRTKEEVLRDYLVIDYLADKTTGYRYALAPVKVKKGNPLARTGERVPWRYAHLEGECIFLQNNLCSLHPDKPTECVEYQCSENKVGIELDPIEYAKEVVAASGREEIVKLWESYHLERFIPQKFTKEHCLENLRLEEQLLAEYQKDFPDIDKVILLESKLE